MLKPFLVASALFCSQAFAAWQLDPQLSDVSFVSVKQSSVAEVHHFTGLDGTISEQGQLQLQIDLSSVESMIPIRNERMRKMLFNVTQYPSATVTADVSTQLAKLPTGTTKVSDVSANLSLHGQIEQLSLDLLVTKGADSLVVTPVKAVIINAPAFGLGKGIEALREIAGLKSIATSVPVSFNLVFNGQD